MILHAYYYCSVKKMILHAYYYCGVKKSKALGMIPASFQSKFKQFAYPFCISFSQKVLATKAPQRSERRDCNSLILRRTRALSTYPH